MKRALVLGGGGVLGVAWESGLMQGLADAGVDVCGFDMYVGTSAGAIVGSYLAAGRIPSRDSQRGGRNPLLEQNRVDVPAVTGVFQLWGQMETTTSAQAAAIGQIARTVHREDEATWVEFLGAALPSQEWPERRLCVVAVDTASGERRVFERDHGVPLGRVLAASASIPGLFPSVSIDGHLYMDGQVHSCANADVVIGERPQQVVIAMPTNSLTARGIGMHAERMLELEVNELRAAGCHVHVRTPSALDAQRMGPNMMDGRRVPDAYAAGHEAGQLFARELG